MSAQAPWWFDGTITAVGILIGAGMIVWQQWAANRAQLRMKLFEDLRAGLRSAQSAVTAVGIRVMWIPEHLDNYHEFRLKGIKPVVPTVRVQSIIDMHHDAMNRAADILLVLEAHDIVSKHFELFRKAVVCATRDIEDAYQALLPRLFRALPVDLPDQGTYVQPLTQSESEELRAVCDAYFEATQELGCYAADILNEAQNLLLGSLFRRRVPPRQPPDPRHRVLRTDDRKILEGLLRYFTEEHPAAARAKLLEGEAATRCGVS